jgi:hypothetical protein
VVTKVLEEPAASTFSIRVELGSRNGGGIRLRGTGGMVEEKGNRKGQNKWMMNMYPTKQ